MEEYLLLAARIDQTVEGGEEYQNRAFEIVRLVRRVDIDLTIGFKSLQKRILHIEDGQKQLQKRRSAEDDARTRGRGHDAVATWDGIKGVLVTMQRSKNLELKNMVVTYLDVVDDVQRDTVGVLKERGGGRNLYGFH